MSVTSYCLFHRVRLPDRYPVQPRPEMAARPPAVVATREGETLLCGCEHAGPHLWPDGDDVEDSDSSAAETVETPDAAPDDDAAAEYETPAEAADDSESDLPWSPGPPDA